ncbi:MAG: hypothetical protein JRE40_13800 [Deltaproteobacteria bacterium]|nr:hypothetical protein [Deltaproteobacteria bacterium]
MSDCPLCKAERLTEWKYSDDVCWVARCKTHGDKWMVVLRRHAREPTPEEMEHVKRVMDSVLPGRRWRYGGRSIRDHFHAHEI